MTSARMKRYTSLNSTRGTKSSFSVQSKSRKVEKGSLAEEICGQIFHAMARRAITPTEHRIKLKANADLCLRRTLMRTHGFRFAGFCFIRFMKPVYTSSLIARAGRMVTPCRDKLKYCPLPDYSWSKVEDYMSEYLREHVGEFLIGAALIVYIVGIFNLTTLGSPITVSCGFAGSFLLMTGIMSKLGLLSLNMSRRDATAVTLFFASSLLFTFAFLSLIIDVRMSYSITNAPLLGFAGPGPGDYFETPGRFFGFNFSFYRPYLWLLEPFVIVAIALFIIAAFIEYTS